MNPKETEQGSAKRSRINRPMLAIAVAVLIGVTFMAGRQYFGAGPNVGEQGAETVSVPAIGGPFTLVDQDGKTVTDATYRGNYMLIYFGYTYCPDVCPTSLSRNADAMDILGERADRIVPILISVDPERDTPEHLKNYVPFFHPRMVGLTGTAEQVADAAKSYRVYYAKVEEDGADPDAYLMDHTSITYLMGPDGQFIKHFSHSMDAEAMAERLDEIL